MLNISASTSASFILSSHPGVGVAFGGGVIDFRYDAALSWAQP
jgi:hypothetical protein